MIGAYNFFQKIDARRLGLTSVGAVLVFAVVVCTDAPRYSAQCHLQLRV
jgi:hypothetical protein